MKNVDGNDTFLWNKNINIGNGVIILCSTVEYTSIMIVESLQYNMNDNIFWGLSEIEFKLLQTGFQQYKLI